MNKEQIDAMITACLPGGYSCDPQVVADDIRDWFKCQSNDAEPAPMKTKHTPGPWYLKHAHPAIIAARKNGDDRFPVPDENWHWGISRISTPAGDFVVTADLQDTPARREANARLIAAAPTMFSYLQMLALGGDDKSHAIIKKITGL